MSPGTISVWRFKGVKNGVSEGWHVESNVQGGNNELRIFRQTNKAAAL